MPLWAKHKQLKARYKSLQTDCAVLEKRVNGIRELKDKRDTFIQLAGLQNAFDVWCEFGVVDNYELCRERSEAANERASQYTNKALDYLEALVKAQNECERLKSELQEMQLSNGGVLIDDVI